MVSQLNHNFPFLQKNRKIIVNMKRHQILAAKKTCSEDDTFNY